jgi:peptide/nickel transport system permease protein
MALVGMIMLFLLVFSALFAEILSPVVPTDRNNQYLSSPPMGIHVFDTNWNFHPRPFVYARTTTRDPETLRKVSVVDETTRWPLEFFVKGSTYKFWGLIETDRHLFGAKGGFIHLFGTDTLGRDVFSRTL